jgi:hypothetical protein
MAIQYTDPTTVDGTKIATDVFNTINVDAFLKPDKTLASLEAKLRKATGKEAIEIQKQIDARQAELTAQYGSVGFGSGGYVIPNYAYSNTDGVPLSPGYADRLATQTAVQAGLAGKMQLIPTATMYTDPFTGSTTNLNPIYQAQYFGPQGQTGYMKDPVTGEIYDPMDPVRMEKTIRDSIAGTTDPKNLRKTFYDESGKELTPEQVAKTAQGVGFAKAGWDIGFGPGMLPGNVNAREIFGAEGNDGRIRDLVVNNLVLSGEMPVAGYDPKTGRVTPTTGATTATGATTTTGTTTAAGTTTSNLSTGAATNPFAPGSDAAKAWNERKSAYDLLYSEFNKYGLASLVTPLRDLIQQGVSPSEFTIQLRNTPQYQRRFAANARRVQSGLAALNEAEYIGLEDAYQGIMRNYGLPEQYYARGDLGVQAGFEKFIGNDVSPAELEDRIQTAERRVRFANPEVGIALKTFYPDITNGDVLAYALDPKTALESLKRRITAAEVGSTAVQMGLATNVTDAEYLARYGVTKQTAQQGYSTIAGGLQRGSQLASIYGEDPYTQTTAEREVFAVPGAQEARAQRQKITGLEKATFGGQTGLSSSALARERAGNF